MRVFFPKNQEFSHDIEEKFYRFKNDFVSFPSEIFSVTNSKSTLAWNFYAEQKYISPIAPTLKVYILTFKVGSKQY